MYIICICTQQQAVQDLDDNNNVMGGWVNPVNSVLSEVDFKAVCICVEKNNKLIGYPLSSYEGMSRDTRD